MNARRGWAHSLERLYLLSVPICLLILSACQSSPAEFNLEYACLHRSLPPCSEAEKFADRVADRTNGRVQIAITSIDDLRIADSEVLLRLKDGTLDMAAIQPAHFFADGDRRAVNEDRAIVEILDLWGVYNDYETQAEVTKVIRKEIAGVITAHSDGVVLAVQFYPSNYFFARKPLRTEADMQGLRTRIPNRLPKDLLTGMGAIPKDVQFASVHQAFQSDQLDAAISCSSCGASLRWNDLAAYLVGPITVLGHSWLTISSETWLELPEDIQIIIQEEAKKHEIATREASLNRWDRRGVKDNVSAGMEHIELTPELKELMRTAALTTVLPDWVRQSGGYDSDAVGLFNQLVAPIVKVEITKEGEAKEIR